MHSRLITPLNIQSGVGFELISFDMAIALALQSPTQCHRPNVNIYHDDILSLNLQL